MSLSLNQSRGVVYQYFLSEGWLPVGTTTQNWDQVKLGDMGIDDPALPSDPHMQKQRIALDLQRFFVVLGSSVASAKNFLKGKTKTLKELAEWLHQNQA